MTTYRFHVDEPSGRRAYYIEACCLEQARASLAKHLADRASYKVVREVVL